MNQNRMDTDQSTQQHSTPLTTLLVGAGIGAALMYLLDPDGGARRRHILGDKTMKALWTGQRHASDAVENARNHAQGKVAEVRGRVQDEEVTDEQLVARVRAELAGDLGHDQPAELAVPEHVADRRPTGRHRRARGHARCSVRRAHR